MTTVTGTVSRSRSVLMSSTVGATWSATSADGWSEPAPRACASMPRSVGLPGEESFQTEQCVNGHCGKQPIHYDPAQCFTGETRPVKGECTKYEVK